MREKPVARYGQPARDLNYDGLVKSIFRTTLSILGRPALYGAMSAKPLGAAGTRSFLVPEYDHF
jgi:hypothetical protein